MAGNAPSAFGFEAHADTTDDCDNLKIKLLTSAQTLAGRLWAYVIVDPDVPKGLPLSFPEEVTFEGCRVRLRNLVNRVVTMPSTDLIKAAFSEAREKKESK